MADKAGIIPRIGSGAGNWEVEAKVKSFAVPEPTLACTAKATPVSIVKLNSPDPPALEN